MPFAAEPEAFLLEPEADECPVRVDAFVAERIEDVSRSRIQKLIRDGEVRVDGRVVKPGLRLQGGEQVVVRFPPAAEPSPQPEAIPLHILYEDEDLLVVDKPAGMVVHPGAGVRSGTLVNALLGRGQGLSAIGAPLRPGIVHRLDRLTSGCLVVALNDAAHHALSRQLAERTMKREYAAWVVGRMPEAAGRVDAPIGRSSRDRTKMAVAAGGRPAATRWLVRAWGPGVTRIECRLETGRTHQIRVHMHHIGHPVVGDEAYGFSLRDARMRIPQDCAPVVQALARCDRQLLHAFRLTLTHPRSGRSVAIDSALPPDFAAFEAAVAPFLESGGGLGAS